MGVSRICQGCFKIISWMIQEIFKRPFMQVSRGVPRGFQGSFIKVSFKSVWRKFQDFLRCFKEVKSSSVAGVSRLFCFWKFIVACQSSQLPKQKEDLFFSIFWLWKISTDRQTNRQTFYPIEVTCRRLKIGHETQTHWHRALLYFMSMG